MLEQKVLAPGTRVRIIGQPISVTLETDAGVIVGPADSDGYYTVRLDHPAQYRHLDGRSELLPELVEYWDNLDVAR